MNYLLQVFLSFILFNFLIQTLCYVEIEEDYITISSKSEDISLAEDCRYNKNIILYEINYGEGFNLRRDVYMRIAQTVQTLRKKVYVVNWGVLSTKHGKMVFDMNEIVPKTVVVSRSHAGKVQELINTALKGQYAVEPAGGSGYKTLGLINSTAEYYIHSTAIKKWDLCAGDAIIRAAGGALIDLEGESMDYNSKLPVLNKKGLFMARKDVYSSFMKIKDYIKI